MLVIGPPDGGRADSDEDNDLCCGARQIVYVDLDNWGCFFSKLDSCLPEGTHVIGFFGGATRWKEPKGVQAFDELVKKGCWRLHQQCMNRRDAADFEIVFSVASDNRDYPTEVPFTVISGDRGFEQLERSCRQVGREFHLINPHHAEQAVVTAVLRSIADK